MNINARHIQSKPRLYRRLRDIDIDSLDRQKQGLNKVSMVPSPTSKQTKTGHIKKGQTESNERDMKRRRKGEYRSEKTQTGQGN